MTAREMYEAGKLSEALQAALAEVKGNPTDLARRYQLVLLLCYNGEFERADRQLEMLSTQHPETAVGVALLRQLIRAELCRQEFQTAGRIPELTAEPTEMIKLHLKASICTREGQLQEAATLLATAEEQRPRIKGKCNGQEFEDFRDLDDLVGPVFEALTSTGKYYWIPMTDVTSLELPEPQSLADLLWRPVRLTMQDGPPGTIYMPMLYFGSAEDEQEGIRLGRATEWVGGDQTPVRGRGLRMFMVGDDARSIVEIQRLELNSEDDPNVT